MYLENKEEDIDELLSKIVIIKINNIDNIIIYKG